MNRLCVFCGSSAGEHPRYLEAATEFGELLAREAIDLVYGGSRIGIMGRLADATLGAGGTVTGVIPAALVDREVAHRGLTELRIVASMHERKDVMAGLAEAFVALPGGLGTLEEFLEVLTWSQLGLHRKPCGALDVGGYFRPLTALLDHMVREGFLSRSHRSMVRLEAEPEALLEALRSYVAPSVPRWIDAGET